jgi:chromosomal replication initiator protein
VYQSLWQSCLQVLEQELTLQQFNMWIRPLQLHSSQKLITLYAPNRFVLDWVRDKYMVRISELLGQFGDADNIPSINFDVGSKIVNALSNQAPLTPSPANNTVNTPSHTPSRVMPINNQS